MSTVLFVCLHNAGRSQMSAALFEQTAAGRHRALSAGTTPAERVHPEVVEVMRELGIDLADRTPQLLTRELAEQADVVVTMGCGDACPHVPGKRCVDWQLADPKNRPREEVRATREDIAQRVAYLKARNIYVLFNTNGTVLTEANGRALIEAGLDELRVSLDAADPAHRRFLRAS